MVNSHRLFAASLLSGRGLEIGALHRPAWLPDGATVEYADAQSAQDARVAFPELADEALVVVDHIIDLDVAGLASIEDERYDFVIFSHVIEHVANPIRVLREIARVLAPGGVLAIAAPDKHFTFDAPRPSTTFAHLRHEYATGVLTVGDDHYEDFLRHVHPEIVPGSAHWHAAIQQVRSRREHAHVWTSAEFKQFIADAFDLLQIAALPLVEFPGEPEGGEYFGVWRLKHVAPTAAPDRAHLTQLPSSWPHPLLGELERRSDTPALRLAVHQLQGDVERLNRIIETLREELASSRQVNDRGVREIEMLRAQLVTERAASELERGEQQVALQQQAALMRAEITARDRDILAMQQSRSWRATAPIRWVSRKLS